MTPDHSRRNFLTRTALAIAVTPFAQLATSSTANATPVQPGIEPFRGKHQGGIATPMQSSTYFIAFDMDDTAKREDLTKLLQAWTDAAATMCAGPAQFDAKADHNQPSGESGATVGIPASRLTITFGFGATLFEKEGKDRYALAKQRPEALVDMPRFAGDQLVSERTGGDLSIQACADDPQVVEYAVRILVKLAIGTASMRWAQMGFSGGFKSCWNKNCTARSRASRRLPIIQLHHAAEMQAGKWKFSTMEDPSGAESTGHRFNQYP